VAPISSENEVDVRLSRLKVEVFWLSTRPKELLDDGQEYLRRDVHADVQLIRSLLF